MTNTKIRIILADDHRIFVEGLRRLIAQENLELAGTASSGAELMELLEHTSADVLVMDINLPDVNGVKLAARVRRKHPKLKILGLTMVEDGRQIEAMMRAGASGYILKSSGAAELLEAIRQVNLGNRYLSNEASLLLLDHKKRSQAVPSQPVAELTQREMEVLHLVAQQLTNVEIAQRLKKSPMTIITHRKNILRKLGLKNTAGLIRYAMKHRLVD